MVIHTLGEVGSEKTILVAMRWLPNILTLANLWCGIMAIIWCLQDRKEVVLGAILACLLFDFFDGQVARALNAHHRLGGQLDSLADMVSFGVLPGIMIVMLLDGHFPEPWIYSGLVFPAAAAIRLATFNLDDRPQSDFYGLPSPAAALFVFGLYAIDGLTDCIICLANHDGWAWMVLATSLIMAGLMISSRRHFNFKSLRIKGIRGTIRAAFLGLAVTLLMALRMEAISSIIVLYILLSLAYYHIKE